MTTAQTLSMLIAPIGALLMAALMLFITRKDRMPEERTSPGKHLPQPK